MMQIWDGYLTGYALFAVQMFHNRSAQRREIYVKCVLGVREMLGIKYMLTFRRLRSPQGPDKNQAPNPKIAILAIISCRSILFLNSARNCSS